VKSCAAKTPTVTYRVDLDYPSGGVVPTSVTVLVGYQSDRISLPGSGQGVATVNARVRNLPSNVSRTINDFDYALRVVVNRASGLPDGRLFTVDFDTCTGTTPPAASEFGCTVEGCGSSTGDVPSCTCSVTLP